MNSEKEVVQTEPDLKIEVYGRDTYVTLDGKFVHGITRLVFEANGGVIPVLSLELDVLPEQFDSPRGGKAESQITIDAKAIAKTISSSFESPSIQIESDED